MSVRITKYEQAFKEICVPLDEKAKKILLQLEREGHTEKSICYAIYKEQDALYRYRFDERFWGIFINKIRKWSWPTGDRRWDDYYNRKKLQTKAKRMTEMAKQVSSEYPGFVYFIQGECGGPIKIGYSTDVAGRLIALQTGYPDTLKLLAIMPAYPEDETAVHEEFKQYRLRGEWFKPVEPLLNKIKELKSKYNLNI